MNKIDVLWTTDPGLVCVGIVILAVVFLFAAIASKFSIAIVVIDIILWIAAIAAVGAVLGLWEIPYIDFFNLTPAEAPIPETE